MASSSPSALPPTPWVKRPVSWILLTSVALASFLLWLIYFKEVPARAPTWVSALPALNALFNGLCATCLVAGFLNIRRGKRRAHIRFMLSAVAFSTLFLVSYITYHHFHGDTPFPGQGVVRPIYFFVLISHISLSMLALPLVLGTLFYALRSQFSSHRRLARWTLPVWLYVSVTGVAVYFFLRAFLPQDPVV